mgnify:CR=1 FL=1
MGFFSFKTDDTNESIPNIYQSAHEAFTVYMRDNAGNTFIESAYDGYGVFGGVDIYELMAEMNQLTISRDEMIHLHFSNRIYLYPALYRFDDSTSPGQMIDCELQGYFYEF